MRDIRTDECEARIVAVLAVVFIELSGRHNIERSVVGVFCFTESSGGIHKHRKVDFREGKPQIQIHHPAVGEQAIQVRMDIIGEGVVFLEVFV